jgi:hypothetical protein
MRKLNMKNAHALTVVVLLSAPALVLADGDDPSATTGKPGNGNQGCTPHEITYKNPGKMFQEARSVHGNPKAAADELGISVGAVIDAVCGDDPS